MSSRFTVVILFAMIFGAAVGTACNALFPDPADAAGVAEYFGLITTVFLRLIKMIIAPLVFSTLVVGIAHMGAGSAVGRIGLKTMGWFLSASVVSLLLGLLMVNLLQPGASLNLPIPDASTATGLKAASLSLKEFIPHLVPASVIEAMATNEILQIVVFSVFAGVAIGALGHRAAGLAALIEQAASMMLVITGYVMKMAPLAVFAAMAGIVTTQGIGVVFTYGSFVAQFYLTLLVLWTLLVLAGLAVLGRPVFGLMRRVREPFLLAFSTASSEAAYPKTLDQLVRFGVSRRIASFVLPLGYSFNLDGTMAYCSFATVFIAQAYGIHLPLGTQLTMLLLLMVTSKGMAGVPRASLVVIAATLATFHIPEAGLLLIMGVDHFLDMGRSATNVIGNSLAAAVVAKWEGALDPAGEDARDEEAVDALAGAA